MVPLTTFASSSFPWFRVVALPLPLYAFSDRCSPLRIKWWKMWMCPLQAVTIAAICICTASALLVKSSLVFFLLEQLEKSEQMKWYKYCNFELALIYNKNFSSTWSFQIQYRCGHALAMASVSGCRFISLSWLKPIYTFLFFPKLFPNGTSLCTC